MDYVKGTSFEIDEFCEKLKAESISGEFTTAQLADIIAGYFTSIENAQYAASETQPSWKHRCNAIMSALGFDYGDPDFELPDVANAKDLEIERLRSLFITQSDAHRDHTRSMIVQHNKHRKFYEDYAESMKDQYQAMVERNASLEKIMKSMVPITVDGNYVFIDGEGDVELDHGCAMRAMIKALRDQIEKMKLKSAYGLCYYYATDELRAFHTDVIELANEVDSEEFKKRLK